MKEHVDFFCLQPECVLIQTKELKMTPNDAERVFGSDAYTEVVSRGMHDKTNKNDVCPAKIDQPGHLPSLISLGCPLEETVGPYLPRKHTANTLI